jgi:hypothetical protein
MLARIQELDTQLKDLDASIGQYQRNVGNYSGAFKDAFEEAFTKGLDLVGEINPDLKGLTNNIAGMLPLIKKVNTVATSGLKGVSKAIASTGIGLLIIAVGELVANWDKVKSAVGNLIGVKDDYTAAVEASKLEQEALKQQIEETTQSASHQVNMMAAQGASRKEQLEYELEQYMIQYKKIKKAISEKRDWIFVYEDSANRKVVKQKKEELAELEQQRKDYYNQYILTTENAIAVEEALLKRNAEAIVANAERALMTKEELLTDAYNKDIEILTQYGLDTVAREKQYQKELAALRASGKAKETVAIDTEAQERAKAVEAILKRLEDGKKDELELLADKYDQEKALLEAAGQDITDLTTEYETQRLAIIQKNEEAAAEMIRRTEEAKYNRASAKLDTDADQEIFMAEIEISNEQLKAEKIYEINKKLLEDKIALQEEYLANFTGDIETQLALETELAESKQALGNLELQYKKDLSDREIELAKETAAMKKEAAFSLVDATVAILDMMADLSEEDSKKQKNLQIASTTIQTIAGAAGAFLQGMMQYGLPFGAIIGAAGAAVATATGIAQIAKIKSTNTSSSSSPSGSISTPTVSPQIPEFTPEYTQNLTGASEIQNLQDSLSTQKVVLVESDVEAALNKSNSRKVETTW